MSERLLYVSCAEKRQIYTLAMERQTGTLRTVAITPAPGLEEGGHSMPLALSPDRRVLYAAIRSAPYPCASFAVDPRYGQLALKGVAPLVDQMCYIVTDRTGRHLLSATYFGSRISSNPIDEHGVVRSPATQVIDTPPKAHSILADPANRFVFAASLGGDCIVRASFDAETGRMNVLPPVKAKKDAGPRHLRFSPDGRFLYLINELDGTINVYRYDAANGALAELQSVTLLPPGVSGKVASADIHITPDGRFLYGSERVTNTLAAFRVDAANGTLKPIGSVPSEPSPRGFAIDPTGSFLLCAGQTSNRVAVYTIDQQSGALNRIGEHDVGENPNWIEFLDPVESGA
jgi:6-phosphogluconolactonase